jgi:hypothetical protein
MSVVLVILGLGVSGSWEWTACPHPCSTWVGGSAFRHKMHHWSTVIGTEEHTVLVLRLLVHILFISKMDRNEMSG